MSLEELKYACLFQACIDINSKSCAQVPRQNIPAISNTPFLRINGHVMHFLQGISTTDLSKNDHEEFIFHR